MNLLKNSYFEPVEKIKKQNKTVDPKIVLYQFLELFLVLYLILDFFFFGSLGNLFLFLESNWVEWFPSPKMLLHIYTNTSINPIFVCLHFFDTQVVVEIGGNTARCQKLIPMQHPFTHYPAFHHHKRPSSTK